MDSSKAMKFMQQKIIELSSELQATKQEKDELACQYQKIKTLLFENNHELQKKAKENKKLMEINQKIKKNNQDIRNNLSHCQQHRKAIFDHLFANQHNIPQIRCNQIKNNLQRTLKKVNNQYVATNYQQFEKIIQKRNSEVKKLSKQYNELIKHYLKSTNQYQEKITNLKKQNFIMKKKQILNKSMLSTRQQSKEYKYEELQILNKSLQEKLDLLIERQKNSQIKILELRKQLEMSQKREKQALLKINMKKNQNIHPEIDQILQIIHENRILKQQIFQPNQQYQKLPTQFCNGSSNEQQFVNVSTNYKVFFELESKNSENKVKLQQFYQQIKKQKQNKQKYEKQLNLKIKQQQGNIQSYEIIINKFKSFFNVVHQHTSFQYRQVGLNEQQINILKRGKNPLLQSLHKQKSDLQQKVNTSTKKIDILGSEIAKLTTTIMQNQNRKIVQMQAINQGFTQYINNNKSSLGMTQNNYLQFIMQNFTKLQQQRNNLMMDVRSKQLKIIQLKIQIDFFKDNNLTLNHMQQTKLNDNYQINFCQPSIVWINFNQDMKVFAHELESFSKTIEDSHKNYQFNLKQIKSEYESQLIKLRQMINRLQVQQKQKNNQTICNEQGQSNPQKQRNEQIAMNQHGSTFQIEDHLMQQQIISQPINTLRIQSIQEMKKILTNHENNLKNLLQAYNQLKIKLQNIQEKEKDNKPQDDQLKIKKYMQNCVNELKLVKIRLQNSDKNLIALQTSLALKQEQLATQKSQRNQQIQSLKQTIDKLQQQINIYKKQNNLQIPQYSIKQKNKNYFPEEIQYLLQLVLIKQQQLQLLKKQQKQSKSIEQNPNLRINQNDNSKLVHEQQQLEIQKIFRNGKLMECLRLALQHLKGEQQE